MGRPVSYNQLPFYLKKLNALLEVQPCVYATELFPGNWKAVERHAMIKEINDTEEFYILEMKEVRFFKDFKEYQKAKEEIEISIVPAQKLSCVTLIRPSGSKISIWPAELPYVLKELHAFQDSLATRHLEKD